MIHFGDLDLDIGLALTYLWDWALGSEADWDGVSAIRGDMDTEWDIMIPSILPTMAMEDRLLLCREDLKTKDRS